MSGRFIFFIPGIKSITAFELPTNSFYAMNAAIQRFETIAFLRGGRISGFLDGKRTPFYLTKKLVEVPHIDEEGRSVRVKQWIIDLEAPIDVTALLRANEDDETALPDARAAVAVIEGPGCPARDAPAARGPAGWKVVDAAQRPASEPADAIHTPPAAAHARNAYAARPSSATSAGPRTASAASPTLEDVLGAAQGLGVDGKRYEQYATKRWGVGWKANPSGRRLALNEIERFRATPDELVAKMDAEIDVFA